MTNIPITNKDACRACWHETHVPGNEEVMNELFDLWWGAMKCSGWGDEVYEGVSSSSERTG